MTGSVPSPSGGVSASPHAVAIIADAAELSVPVPEWTLAPGVPSLQPCLSDREGLDAPLSSPLSALHSAAPAATVVPAILAAASDFELTGVDLPSREGEMIRPRRRNSVVERAAVTSRRVVESTLQDHFPA